MDAPTLPAVDASSVYESLDGPEPIKMQVSPASNESLKQMIEQNHASPEQTMMQSDSVPVQSVDLNRSSSSLGKMIKRFALAAVAVVLIAGVGVYIAASRTVVN